MKAGVKYKIIWSMKSQWCQKTIERIGYSVRFVLLMIYWQYWCTRYFLSHKTLSGIFAEKDQNTSSIHQCHIRFCSRWDLEQKILKFDKIMWEW